MSFILGALKKAERDRPRQKGPDINQLISTERSPRREGGLSTGVRFMWLPVIFLLILIFWFGQLGPGQVRHEDNSAPFPVETSGPESISEPESRMPATTLSPASNPPAQPSNASPTPASAARSIDELVIEGSLVYEDDPGRTRIFINGQSFRVGEEVAPNVRIERVEDGRIYLRADGILVSRPL